MKERSCKTLEVKSLITFGITSATVIYLAVKGSINKEDVMLLAGMVFTYFFNRKTENKLDLSTSSSPCLWWGLIFYFCFCQNHFPFKAYHKNKQAGLLLHWEYYP